MNKIDKGVRLLLSSVSATLDQYSAGAKAAVTHFTKMWAELPVQPRVNSISPAAIATPISCGGRGSEKIRIESG